MNILVVCQHYWPEQFQITTICEELAKRGHEVTVLVGLPNYPSGVIPLEYRHGKNRIQEKKGVKIVRVREVPRKSGAISLAINYYSYSQAAAQQTKRLSEDFDVIFAYQLSPVLMAIPAVKYKQRTGAPLLLYCLDLWPESMKVMLGNRYSFLLSHYEKVSKEIYNSADIVALQSSAFAGYFKQVHEISEDKLVYLPQFATSEYLDMDFEQEHEGISFVFLGNIGRAQDIFCILNALLSMSHKTGFRVHFVGDGARLEAAKRFVAENLLDDRVFFHGQQSFSKMPEYYSLADACLLTLDGSNWIGNTLPSKLQGYMAAGKPILAAINGGARDVIKESGCGVCVDAGDAQNFARIIDDFIDNPEVYRHCGAAGREYFKMNFTCERFIESLEKLLKNLVERKTSAQR